MKVLLLYPNGKLLNPPPISIGIFTALLKQKGFTVGLFDTTFYADNEKGSDEAKQDNLQVRPSKKRNIWPKDTCIEADLMRKVEEFKPDLIVISILESTWPTALRMIRALNVIYNIPTLAGGVFPTFAPEIVFPNVDMVCIGEGEEVLVEICERMAQGYDCSHVKNLYKNKLREPVNLDELPIPDYSLFDSARFLRPMGGKVYRTIPIETNRGCPYSCAFCNSPAMNKLYDNKYFRKKSMSKIKEEILFLIKKWDAEYIYFCSDTFLMLTDKEFEDFINFYKDIKLPFWMQTRVESITEYRMKKLKEVGCHRMSIGLEHGNAEFRKKLLKKNFDNSQIIMASKMIASAGIPLTVNNIIGFPDETRELIFNTIELNRQLTFDTANATAFTPFHGTPLHKLCLERGYISEDYTTGSLNVDVALDMPQLSREEVKGLQRTFALYVKLPRSYWPQIKRAERFDKIGNRYFNELKEIYKEKYFNGKTI